MTSSWIFVAMTIPMLKFATVAKAESLSGTSTVWHRYNRYLGHNDGPSGQARTHHRQGPTIVSWSTWSNCSKSCGRGNRTRTRECQRTGYTGNANAHAKDCTEKKTEYKECNTQICHEDSSKDSRNSQCTLYNGRTVSGQVVNDWIYRNGGSNPCELMCYTHQHRFYYSFGKSIDGTNCLDGKSLENGKCLNGRCVFRGCDGRFGSRSIKDHCGICGGHDRSCRRHRDVYKGQQNNSDVVDNNHIPSFGAQAHYGYEEVIRIPSGSYNVRIHDVSRNYLALIDERDSFILNGNWKIDWPGLYEVNDDVINYTRRAHNESIYVLGPTTQRLRVMALMMDENPGVYYEYWHPIVEGSTNDARTERPSRWSPTRTDRRITHHQQATATVATTIRTKGSIGTTRTVTIPTTEEIIGKKTEDVTPVAVQTNVSRKRKGGKKTRRRKRRKKSGGGNRRTRLKLPEHCKSCRKVKGAKKNFCNSDFVLRVGVTSMSTVGTETRYEVAVIKSYKNTLPMLTKEFVWVTNPCMCPYLRRGRQYLIMGKIDENFTKRETRLVLDDGSFVRRHNRKNAGRILRISTKRKKICRRRRP